MKLRSILAGVFLIGLSTLLYGCGGGGGGAPAPSNVSINGGNVIDGYLSGAFVFADCNGNKKFDSGEPHGITDSDGNIGEITVPVSCKDANLIATGGTDIATGLPFYGVLMAKAGSKNITPLTTLVTVNPAFAAKLKLAGITDPGADYISSPNSSAAGIAQAVGATLSVIGKATKVSNTSSFYGVVEKIADSLNGNDVDISDTSSFASAVAAGAKDAVNELKSDPNATIANVDTSSFEDSINKLAAAVKDAGGDASKVKAATDDADSSAASVITAFTITPENLAFAGQSTTVTDGSFSLPNITTGDVDISKELKIGVSTNSSAFSSWSEKTYSNVSLTAVVTDSNSTRRATVRLYPINIVVDVSGTISSVTVPADAELTVSGTDSKGNPVSPVVIVNKIANSTMDGTIGTDCPAGGSNCFSFDLGVVENKIQAQVPASNPLYQIGSAGDYELTIRAEGLPMDAITGNIKVQ